MGSPAQRSAAKTRAQTTEEGLEAGSIEAGLLWEAAPAVPSLIQIQIRHNTASPPLEDTLQERANRFIGWCMDGPVARSLHTARSRRFRVRRPIRVTVQSRCTLYIE